MKLKEGNALVLRTCRADMSSKNGFVWPAVGKEAIAPDWVNNNECGAGLHGWLYGQGDHGCSSYLDDTAKWLVVEVVLADVVILGGKIKFERCTVRFVGEKKEAADFLLAHELQALNVAVIGASRVVGDAQPVQVGSLGTATAGDRGTATAGDRGAATAGDSGTATAGDSGTATAGDRGEIRIRWYDNKNNRYRTVVGYIGEDGLLANIAYRLNSKNEFKAVAEKA